MTKRWILFSALCAFAAFICGCGGKNGLIGGGGGPVLQAIILSPTNPTVTLATSPPATKQFIATGTYNFGNPQDITSQVTWTSLDTTVATMDKSGVATATGSGRVIITAMFQDPLTQKVTQASTTLTVVPLLTGITVSPASAQIAKGTSQQFTAAGSYNDKINRDITSLVTWNSSQPAVAAVSSSPGTQGWATAAAPGSTSIMATLGSVSSAPSTLTVSNANLVSLAVTPANSALPLANAQQFVATGSFDDGTQQDISGTVQWSSSNPSAARVSSVGVVTGAGLGSTTIQAQLGDITDSTTASVDASSVVAIVVPPLPFTPIDDQPPLVTKIANLTSYQMRAMAVFKSGSALDVTHTPGVQWSSSDSSVISVAADNGLASAKSPGTATITATLGKSGSNTLLVSDATLQAFGVAPSNAMIAPGTTQNVVAMATFTDDLPCVPPQTTCPFQQDVSRSAAWSDPTGLTTLSYADGLQEVATGIASGTAKITASFADAHGNAQTASAPLLVSSAQLTGINISPGSADIPSGGGHQYVATASFTDGTQQDITRIANWNPANSAVATVSAFGYAAASGPGQTSISATMGVQTGSSSLVVNSGALMKIDICAATVKDPLNNCPPLDPLVPPPPIMFAQSIPYPLIAIGTFADGSREDLTGSLQWGSVNPAVAAVSNDPGVPGFVSGVPPQGVVTGLSAGTATITASAGAVTGTQTVTVTAASPQLLTVTPMNGSTTLGINMPLTVAATFPDNSTQDVTAYVQWMTSDPGVVVVNPGGLAYPSGKGVATVTAILGYAAGSTTLTVQ